MRIYVCTLFILNRMSFVLHKGFTKIGDDKNVNVTAKFNNRFLPLFSVRYYLSRYFRRSEIEIKLKYNNRQTDPHR